MLFFLLGLQYLMFPHLSIPLFNTSEDFIQFCKLIMLLQVLAIPAIPLTMSAGLLFGSFTGTILVSISGTVS